MINNFSMSKGHNGYIIHNNGHITEAAFKNLEESGDLRTKVVNWIFTANQNLRSNIKQINEALDKRYRSKPTIQVELVGNELFHVFCRTGSERYVATAISFQDVQENPLIATKFIELLYEDYAQLKSIINALSELEEVTILTYSNK